MRDQAFKPHTPPLVTGCQLPRKEGVTLTRQLSSKDAALEGATAEGRLVSHVDIPEAGGLRPSFLSEDLGSKSQCSPHKTKSRAWFTFSSMTLAQLSVRCPL